MERFRALVVEDEPDILALISIHLGRDNIAVDCVDNGREAQRLLALNVYDIAILDWMLPEVSGIQLVREIRARSKGSPSILMVTAKTSNVDIISGLEAGADDYLSKPFEVSVLMARVRALLRRSGRAEKLLSLGSIRMDLDSHVVKINDEVVSLTPYEFKLLKVLAENKGRVLTRDQLIENVQGDVTIVARAVDTHVFGLRKKLGENASLIETVRGVGYRVSKDR